MNKVYLPRKISLGPISRDDHVHLDETSIIKKLVGTRTGTMIDVGAHHGRSCIPFLNDGWRIYAFEPCAKTRKILLKNVSENADRTNLYVDHRCVGSEDRFDVAFYESTQSTGISSLSAFHSTHVETQRTDVVTLSRFMQENNIGNVDFLKIDSEGHDLLVLKGFPWSSHSPGIIECEFEDTKTRLLGYTFHQMAAFLLDKSYDVWISEWHPVKQYGVRHDWCSLSQYPCDLINSDSWGNLLAFKIPVDSQFLVELFQESLRKESFPEKIASLIKSPRKFIRYANRKIRGFNAAN